MIIILSDIQSFFLSYWSDFSISAGQFSTQLVQWKMSSQGSLQGRRQAKDLHGALPKGLHGGLK